MEKIWKIGTLTLYFFVVLLSSHGFYGCVDLVLWIRPLKTTSGNGGILLIFGWLVTGTMEF